jgi:excisionase family DNA binding protein
MVSFKEYLTVKDASDFLGVTIMTLHRWDAAGKLKALRHPINHYRLYKRSDLVKLLKKVSKPGKNVK